jgi:replicative DNA helicase
MVTGKIQPQAIDMEMAVLGAILSDSNALFAVSDIISPDSFYQEGHTYIYSAIVELAESKSAVDILTVTAKLKSKGVLETCGGALYVTQLTNRVNSSAHIEHHAKIIQQAFVLRQLILTGGEVMSKAYDADADPFELTDVLEASLQKVSLQLTGNSSVVDFPQQIKEAVQQIEIAAQNKGVTGVPSKFTLINKVMGGYQPGDLIIIAARPGMGKTAYVMSEARHIAGLHIPVAVFSLEMPYLQLNQRILAGESETDLDRIKSGNLDNEAWVRVNAAHARLREWPITIDDTPSLSMAQLRAKARRLKNKKGIKLVIVDYLQLMRASGKGQNREQEVGEISRGLKALAKELGTPVIALAQLSRASEKRGVTATPMLSDLRESGSIEQDADVVKFLYRPEYYDITEDQNGESTAGKAQVIIAKHRNGSLDKIKLKFSGPHCSFSNLYEQERLYTPF